MCVLSLCRLNSAVIMSLSGASIHVHDWTRDRRPEACQVDGLQQQRYGLLISAHHSWRHSDVTVVIIIITEWCCGDEVKSEVLSQTVSSTLYQSGNFAQWRREGVCRPGQTPVLPPRQSDQFCNQRIFHYLGHGVWTVNQPWGFTPLSSLSFPPLSFSLPFP